MRRHVLTRLAVLGSLLALAACADADAVEGNSTNQLFTTASIEPSAPNVEPGNGKASLFGAPREARIVFW